MVAKRRFGRVLRRGLWTGLVAVMCAGYPTSAWADRAEADAAFTEGSKAYNEGDHRRAADAFDRAFALMPHSVARYSAGLAREASGELAKAADAYAEALEMGQLPPQQAADARTRLASLENRLGTLTVNGEPGSKFSVGHIQDAEAPRSVHLVPGDYDIRGVLADGTPVSTRVTVKLGQVASAKLAAEPEPEPEPTRGPLAPGPEVDEGGDHSAVQKTVGWVALGGGVVAGGIAIVLGTKALSARDDFYDSEFQDADARDRAASLRTWTNVAWISAGLVGATGVVLILTAPSGRRDDGPQAGEVGLRLGPGRLDLGGRF